MARQRGRHAAQGVKAAARMCLNFARRAATPTQASQAACISNELAIKNERRATDAQIERAATANMRRLKREGLAGMQRARKKRR